MCKLKHSVFTAAKKLSVSDIKVCMNSSHMYLTDLIDKVRSFGQLLISVGRVAKYDEGNGSSFVQEDLEWDWEHLPLTVIVPRGKPLETGQSKPPLMVDQVGQYLLEDFK